VKLRFEEMSNIQIDSLKMKLGVKYVNGETS
jgi:hypothetical protein